MNYADVKKGFGSKLNDSRHRMAMFTLKVKCIVNIHFKPLFIWDERLKHFGVNYSFKEVP